MRVHPITEHVREILASADPYYQGPRRGNDPLVAERIRPLDPQKTLRDLGRIDDEHGGTRDSHHV
jgi:hypothetical protein